MIYDHRDHPARFTRFEMKCGMTFGPDPVSAVITMTPSKKEEHFLCRDKDLLEAAGSDREAFYEAVNMFASQGAALAWNGKTPGRDFHVPREMSLDFAHPTMSADIVFRLKGEADNIALRMLFIGFDSALAASIYSGKRAGLLK